MFSIAVAASKHAGVPSDQRGQGLPWCRDHGISLRIKALSQTGIHRLFLSWTAFDFQTDRRTTSAYSAHRKTEDAGKCLHA